jgi:hypothetical protein
MKTRLLALAIFFLWVVPAFAETADTAWVRRYSGPGIGSNYAYALAVDRSGNVYVTGASDGIETSSDLATIKYYPNGDTAWVRRYNGPGNNYDYANAIAVDDSGCVYVTGSSYDSTTDNDYLTIKYLPNGDTAWVRRYNGPSSQVDDANAIAVDDSGNVYVTGNSYDYATNYDYATIKYYPDGDTAWVRRYDDPENGSDEAYALTIDDSGNVYLTGNMNGDYGTIKYYTNGDAAWVRRYNGPVNQASFAKAIAIDGTGNVYVTGYSFGNGNYEDYATVKYDPSGNELWVRRYNELSYTHDAACALAVDDSNNVYVTGSTSYPTARGTIYAYATIKYSSDGDTVWVRQYGSYRQRFPVGLALDTFGNVYVTGDIWTMPMADYATIKYYANGDSAWTKIYNGPSGGGDQASAIAVDDSGNIFVTGLSDNSEGGIDYATIKYVQFLCGDANKDGVVDVGDVVYLINYLYRSGPLPMPILHAGDANCDQVVDVGDVVYVINYLFKGGPAPSC